MKRFDPIMVACRLIDELEASIKGRTNCTDPHIFGTNEIKIVEEFLEAAYESGAKRLGKKFPSLESNIQK